MDVSFAACIHGFFRKYIARPLLVAVLAAVGVGCATLTEEAMTPIAMSFSDGSNGKCELSNKRGLWNTDVPSIVSVRKSDDSLKYRCKTDDGREVSGAITSEMGGKIIASAVFLDFGITDAITDKHRKYAESYVVPIRSETRHQAAPVETSNAPAAPTATVPQTGLEPPSPLGKNEFTAMQMAKAIGCDSAKIISATGSTETYQTACPGGQYKLIQCEFTNCRIMQ